MPQHNSAGSMSVAVSIPPSNLATLAAVIPNGQSTSGTVDLTNNQVMGFDIPPGFLGDHLLFAISPDGVLPFEPAQTETNDPVWVLVTPGQRVTLERNLFAAFAGPRRMQIQAATGVPPNPTNQATDITIGVVVRPTFT